MDWAFSASNSKKSETRRTEGVISKEASRVTVRVIRTDEECMIAKTVCRVLGLHGRRKKELRPCDEIYFADWFCVRVPSTIANPLFT